MGLASEISLAETGGRRRLGDGSLIDQPISDEHSVDLRTHFGVQGGGRIVGSGRRHLDGCGRGGVLAGHGEGETSEGVHPILLVQLAMKRGNGAAIGEDYKLAEGGGDRWTGLS